MICKRMPNSISIKITKKKSLISNIFISFSKLSPALKQGLIDIDQG